MREKDIYEAMNQGVLLCDEKSRLLYFNSSYSRFIGYRLEEICGKPIRDIRPGAVVPDVIANGKPQESLFRVENDQEYFADVYPVMEDGQVVGSVSVVTSMMNANCIKDKMLKLEEQEKVMKDRLSRTNGTHYSFEQIICSSPKTLETIAKAKKVARHPVNILLQGESGCGKELFAQSIHNESDRRDAPFVAINCAALNKTMLESELFGYENGAFTGARKGGKPGLFETAKGGTLFLDEISEMDYDLQAKLLRVLQEKKFRRIGGLQEIDTDIRLISACNVNLQQYIEEKKFRMDLFYRIAVFPLTIPPLRERREDILPLMKHYLHIAEIQNKQNYTFTDEVKERMYCYDWPGNVRELRNTVEYCALMALSTEITLDCLPPSLLQGQQVMQEENIIPLDQRIREFEKNEIMHTLDIYGRTTDGKKKAAKALGISLSSLYNKIGKSET